MAIRVVTDCDKEFVMGLDPHVDDTGYASRVFTESGYVIWEGAQRIGVIAHCILWDTLPFMSFLFLLEEYRGRGFARQAIGDWEKEMRARGYRMALISARADEGAQHIYRKLGYVDCGGLVFYDTPLDQPMELFFRKVL